jgi:hypothetical protein
MKKLTLMLFICTLVTGCASIVSKSHYDLAINSEPIGANFVVSNKAGKRVYNGSTPATVKLSASAGYFKNETYTINLNKPGYDERTYYLSSSLDGWYWGNLLLGGIVGMLVVDPATGAMYKLPESVDITLEKSSASSEDVSLSITTIDSLNAEQVSRLQLVTTK